MRVLLIDTCGEVGCVALAKGDRIVSSEHLPIRESSATLLPAISRLLVAEGWTLLELDGIGVVSGPGSFTGVRVGMAVAKGLCEAAQLPLAAISRLEILANAAALHDGLAILDAGRGEFYVRSIDGAEKVIKKDDLCALVGAQIVVAEARARDALAVLNPEMYTIEMQYALPAVHRSLVSVRLDAAQADANYGRPEMEIYPYSSERGDAVE